MKPTQITELLANIKKTFVSFFSILMFVALGVGIFVGINWSSPALESMANSEFDDNGFHHFQVIYPYGLTQDDVDQLAQVDGVTQVEAGRQSFVTYRQGERRYVLKMQTIGQDIDRLVVKEGELPQRAGEIALKASTAKELGFGVGDTITFEHDATGGPSLSALADPDVDLETIMNTTSEDADGMAQLVSDTFTITALAESPEYVSLERMSYGFSTAPSGATDGIIWAMPDAFDAGAYLDGFTNVNVRCESLEGLSSFGAEYKQKESELKDRIVDLGNTLGYLRYDSLHGRFQKKVDEGEEKLREAEDMIAKGERAAESGEQELAMAKSVYEQVRTEGESRLAEIREQVSQFDDVKGDANAVLSKAEGLIDAAKWALRVIDDAKADAKAVAKDARAFRAKERAKLEAGKITKEEYREDLDSYAQMALMELTPYAKKAGIKLPNIGYSNYSKLAKTVNRVVNALEDVTVKVGGKSVSVRKARTMLKSFQREAARAKEKFERAVSRLSAMRGRFNDAEAELEQRLAQYESQIAEGEAQLKEAKSQIAQGKKKIEESKPKLEEAKQKLEEVKQFGWTVAGRSYNGGYMQVSTFAGVTNRLSFSMAALFVIVGLLVSYSAVGRIVHEQITQVGTKKALGLRRREISMSFLAYSGLAVIAGAIVGLVMGTFVVEGIISWAVGAKFISGMYPPYFGIELAVVVTLLELALVLGATYLACRRILEQHAVELLKGEKPPAGKAHFYEKWRFWDKLPLFTQTMVNNCVNDKRRVFSTVVGVAGCTALIVTAITLNDDVLASYDKHYADVYGFNAIAYVDPLVEGSDDAVHDALAEEGVDSARVQVKYFSATQPDGSLGMVRTVVPEDIEEFSRVYHINPANGGTADLTAEGVWVTRAYAEHLGAKPGDELTLDSGDGAKRRVVILGFYEFELTYYEAIMSRDLYERVFEAKIAPNALFANTGERAVEEVGNRVVNTPGFVSIVDDKTYQRGNFDSFSSISATVVGIYLALAALMAIVVLLNLNVMFIEEKKRDLIVLMINGFSVRDAKRYIYNDTIVLTAIGIVLGLVLGAAMGSLTVSSIEPATASFLKGVAWRAIAVGAVGSALLAFIMCKISLRRIPGFDLTDINKF